MFFVSCIKSKKIDFICFNALTKKLVRFYHELAVSDNISIASLCCVTGILPCYCGEFLLQVKENTT